MCLFIENRQFFYTQHFSNPQPTVISSGFWNVIWFKN